MSFNAIYTQLVQQAIDFNNDPDNTVADIRKKLDNYIRLKGDEHYPFEVLESICLSGHYILEVGDFRFIDPRLGLTAEDIVDYVCSSARMILTERYRCQLENGKPSWVSPCVSGRRLTVDALKADDTFRVLYGVTMTSIGYGVNQTLFGMFRNFREPEGEMEMVTNMIKRGTIIPAIDAQFAIIRGFIREAMFSDHDDRDLQSRGNYAMGLLRMFQSEIRSFVGPTLRHRVQNATPEEAVRLVGGVFRLIRRNTRNLRCELSYLTLKVADLDNQAIRQIADHARENAIEMVTTKTFKEI